MIFNKYQIINSSEDRGYSKTCIIQNDKSEKHFAKWIKGIQQDSQTSRILSDKLRQLKKAKHTVLPHIIEYGWDENEGAYCIISTYKETKTATEVAWNVKPHYFLKGILEILTCLQSLQQKHNITHGDLSPSNILINPETLEFYLVDFGMTDISATLSQQSDLVVFTQGFAAPEKWKRDVLKGFDFQSDIYSMGKIIEWYFEQKQLPEFEAVKQLIDLACKENPAHRLNYNSFIEELTKITRDVSFEGENVVSVSNANERLIEELNSEDFTCKFDIRPQDGNNILLDIITKNYWGHCLWLIGENRLRIQNFSLKEENTRKYENTLKYGKTLGLPMKFTQYHNDTPFDLTPIFKKIQKEKQTEQTYNRGREARDKELNFFEKLLKKEKEIFKKNSLRLRYLSWKKEKNNLHFKIGNSEEHSSNGHIYHHIDKSNGPQSEEFQYILNTKSNIKSSYKTPKLTGIAYDFYSKERVLKFKDCYGMDFNNIPSNGYLFEDIHVKEIEKDRQLKAIGKVRRNEVQNRDLMHYLFNPNQLKGTYLNTYELPVVYQEDNKGNPFEYSDAQKKAIINALERKPLTLIQGPPGTGKTTVITEIVFQVLNSNPDAKILITSQTNDAVDNVLENLLKKEIPFVRLSGKRQPNVKMQPHTLEKKIEGWKQEVKKKTKTNWKRIEQEFKQKLEAENIFLLSLFEKLVQNKSWKIKRRDIEKIITFSSDFKTLENTFTSENDFIEALDELTKIDIKTFFKKQKIHKKWLSTLSSFGENSRINQKLIDSIRVIGATTNHIASGKYAKYNFAFDYVIMDESGKATTAESLIPIVLAERLVLVGDHRQLRPMLTADEDVKKWLKNEQKNEIDYEPDGDILERPSLFEQVIRKIELEFTSQLEVCRRSSAEQVVLTSKCFYEPYGEKIKPSLDRKAEDEHNLDLKINSSIIFLDIGQSKERQSKRDGKSIKNEGSAKLIPEILKGLDKQLEEKKYSIGIITGYKAQDRLIKKNLRNVQLKNIKKQDITASVVDRFQGLERDIIIFDLVRSGERTLGFLANANRINVALSRQKRLLIIVGNLESLSSAMPPKHFREKHPDTTPALQKYLKNLKKEWIVNNIEQIF